MVHYVKTYPKLFIEIVYGRCAISDFFFSVPVVFGDTIIFSEYNFITSSFTGKVVFTKACTPVTTGMVSLFHYDAVACRLHYYKSA